jgi:hypothetical protein
MELDPETAVIAFPTPPPVQLSAVEHVSPIDVYRLTRFSAVLFILTHPFEIKIIF